jgi:hypothetical protein
MKYKIKSQCGSDDRTFLLEDTDGNNFYVDIYTDGGLNIPKYVSNGDGECFVRWLKSFVGKTVEIDRIVPLYYYTNGKIKVKRT